MIVSRVINNVAILDGTAPAELLDAMKKEGFIYMIVNIFIANFKASIPMSSKGYPIEGAEWDQLPMEPYGMVVLKVLSQNPCTAPFLFRSDYADIARVIDDAVAALDLTLDVLGCADVDG